MTTTTTTPATGAPATHPATYAGYVAWRDSLPVTSEAPWADTRAAFPGVPDGTLQDWRRRDIDDNAARRQSDIITHVRTRLRMGCIGATVTTDRPELRLTSADITVTVDCIGREVIVIPDAVAEWMRAQVQHGWREIPDVAHGHSRPFAPGTHMHACTMAIMEAYGASSIPAGLDARDQDRAIAQRAWAACGFQMIVAVVGRSGWDDDAAWWRDYDTTRHLHIPGYPSMTSGYGSSAGAGRGAVEWTG